MTFSTSAMKMTQWIPSTAKITLAAQILAVDLGFGVLFMLYFTANIIAAMFTAQNVRIYTETCGVPD